MAAVKRAKASAHAFVIYVRFRTAPLPATPAHSP
jgi:hypothetical protein